MAASASHATSGGRGLLMRGGFLPWSGSARNLVPGNLGVDLARPRVDAAREVSQPGEALAAQVLERLLTALAAMAGEHEQPAGGQLLRARGQRSERHVQRIRECR